MIEREMKVIAKDFEPKGTNEFGNKYERETGEFLELWDNGTVRYLSKGKESYTRIFNEVKNDNFTFSSSFANNRGDKFITYTKDSLNSSFGYFTSIETYCIAVNNIFKTVEVQEFLPVSFMVGNWGRVSILNGGRYSFHADGTFSLEHSNDGIITGKWKTDKKIIILNYNKKLGEYGIAHSLSMKTEIIHVTNKLSNTIDGYLSNEIETITLTRQ